MSRLDVKQRVQVPALRTQYLWNALRERNYSSGPDIERLEERLAIIFGFRGAKTVSSGYEALRLAIFSSGKAGGNIAVANYSSCNAMVDAVMSTGSKPIYCDLNSESLSIDLISLQKAQERERIDLVIAPSHMGIKANIQAIGSLGIPVIEDACQSFHTRLKLKSPAEMLVLSFYPTKNFNCISGGAVLFKDGIWQKYKERTNKEERKEPGHWGHNHIKSMPNLHCAIGLGNLLRLEEDMKELLRIKRVYAESIPHKWLLKEQIKEDIVPWRFLVRSDGRFGIEDLRTIGIESDKEFTQLGEGSNDKAIEGLLSIPYYIGMKTSLARDIGQRFCRMTNEINAARSGEPGES